MKQFIKIFLSNIMPSKQIILILFAGFVGGGIIILPLILIHNIWLAEAAYLTECWFVYVTIKSVYQYFKE